MKRWSLPAPFCIAAAVAAFACAGGGPPKPLFERHYERYRSQPHQKAMAIAGDLHGEWTYGYGYAFKSTGLAIDQAFETCNARRRKLEGVGECRLYAVGNEVVDGNPELEARYGRH